MSQDTNGKRKRNVAFKEANEIESAFVEDLSRPCTPLLDPVEDDRTGGASAKKSLGDEIRANMIITGERGRDDLFLPRNRLEKLLIVERTTEALAKALSETKRMDARPSPIEMPSSDQLAKRKEIVAILSLIEKLPAILDFITEGIDDNDLPFEREQGPSATLGKTLKRRDSNGSLRSINLFSSWKSRDIEAFENQQYKIHVPVFSDIGSNAMAPPHWDLAPRTVLPYVDSTLVGTGGFSAVSRVELHPGHCDGVEGKPKRFAVKKLQDSSEDAFQEEVSSLRRFMHKDHPHLIKLLWTFSRGSDYHLVFPCAKGNLMDLWKAHPQPLAAKHDPSGALWVARQCLGIIQALCMIHQDDDHGSSSGGTHKRHGRHGDLKPENILCFDSANDDKPDHRQWVLTISDFGLADFHDTNSKSGISLRRREVGVSWTYRAPEYDIHKKIALNYDIWSLACVLLEFLMWYLKGWEEVEKFSKERQEEHSNPYLQEDTFFSYVLMDGRNGHLQPAARAKRSVYKAFQELYDDEQASDFSNDLLDFIADKLLRMNPKERAGCTEVKAAFQKVHDECERDDGYCIRRLKKPPRRKTTDLSLLEAVVVDIPKEVESSLPRHNVPSDCSSTRFLPPRRNSGSSTPRKRRSISEATIQEEPDAPDPEGHTSPAATHVPGPRPSPQADEQRDEQRDTYGRLDDNAILSASPKSISEPFEGSDRERQAGSIQQRALVRKTSSIALLGQHSAPTALQTPTPCVSGDSPDEDRTVHGPSPGGRSEDERSQLSSREKRLNASHKRGSPEEREDSRGSVVQQTGRKVRRFLRRVCLWCH